MDEHLSRRERKKQKTRLRLMQTALRLFREQGYDATTIEQITKATDVAKGTFFNYFTTKEAILPALIEWRLQELQSALLPEEGAPASPIARIKLALRLVAQDPLIDHALARQMFAAMAQLGQPPDNHPGRALTQLLTDQVRQAQEAGEVRAGLDSTFAACIIRALFFQQLMTWHHGYCSAPLPEMLDAAIDLLLDGIAGPNWKHVKEE
jgi:AcrR family transcriptional regulator